MHEDQPSEIMDSYVCLLNLLQFDSYAFYLAQLCEENPVRASANIFAQSGQLLLPVSTLISRDNLEQVAAHLLQVPLSHSVAIQQPMTNADFLQHLLNTIRQTEFFQSLEERKYPLESLQPVSQMLECFPLVQQRLTVMAAQMNDLFLRTLSVSLWSIFIAQEMRLPVEETQRVFWAAITHDFGMMHIAPWLLSKKGELTAAEWRCLQSHVDISRNILLNIPEIPPEVVATVYEHHERCDGTGYPHGKVESEISLHGQILALADTIVGIYFNRCKPTGRRWRDVLPVLELNRAAYLYRGCEIVSTMIFRSEMPLDGVVEGGNASAFAEKMLQQNIQLQQWFGVLRDSLTSVGFTHGDRKLHGLQNSVLHIATTFKGSLLFKEDLRVSMESVANAQGVSVSKMVEVALLRQQEMTFHLYRLTRMMQLYIASGECKNPKIAAQLQAGLVKMGGFLLPPA